MSGCWSGLCPPSPTPALGQPSITFRPTPAAARHRQRQPLKIAGLGGWYIRRQIANYQAGVRAGADSGDTFGMQMAPMARTLATPAALENVIAYIDSLPNEEPETTITGDTERGARLYQSCSVCHGDNGEGRWNANAPPLANMSDWYLSNQLSNFQQRIRGGHADDIYGDQMYMLATSLNDDQAINDVIAYINSL